MSFTVIIPARYQASRFPGKLLAPLGDKSVLEHCWLSACRSEASRVIIAVDDPRVERAAIAFGAEVCMTSVDCASGTDRVHEAAHAYSCTGVIINLQGDEPLFAHDDINRLAHALLAADDCHMASMMQPFTNDDDIDNPNMVKVVTDIHNRALYFSRAAIPFQRQLGKHFRHLGVYGYRHDFLASFVSWPVSELERTEQLEQLRALSHGARILMVPSHHQGHRGIDTPEDLSLVAALVADNSSH